MKQISSRNQEKERQTKSTGSVKEPNLLHSATSSHFQSVAVTVPRSNELQTPAEIDPESVGEEFPAN